MAIASVVTTYITVKIMHDFMLSVLLIPFLIGVKCTLLDLYIKKRMGISNVKETLYGIIASIVFIFVNLVGANNYLGISIYLFFVMMLLLSDMQNHYKAFLWFFSKAVKH